MPISTGLNNDRINVGIILEEDRQESVSLQWAPGSLIESSVGIPDTHRLEVSVSGAGLLVESGDSSRSVDQLILRAADDVHRLSPADGIAVASVRTGRGFHWQKNIRVTLPGELVLRVRGGCIQMINRVDVESYVACVATSEMGSQAPDALLAAQTVVARCWALALSEKKHVAQGFDVCNDDCCQRYQGTTYVSPRSIQAARETAGQVVVFDDRVIDARYSKNCGGIVEDFTAVWGGDPVPYLVPLWDSPGGHPAPHFSTFSDYYDFRDAFCGSDRFADVDLQAMLGKVDESGSYYRWHHEVEISSILDNLRSFHGLEWGEIRDVRIIKRGSSARIIEIELLGVDAGGQSASYRLRSEYTIRQVFSASFLYSSAFELLNADSFVADGRLRLRGCGWGHGAGLCQMGALGMALEGYSVEDILLHYYPGTSIRSLP